MDRTKRPTIKQARAAHPLAPAVLRQLGGGVEAVEQAIEAGEHGADTGWPGFTYSADLRAFVGRHRRQIVLSITALADDLGEQGGAVGLVRGFTCLNTRPGKPEYTADEIGQALWGPLGKAKPAIVDALGWYALEEVGLAIANLRENGR